MATSSEYYQTLVLRTDLKKEKTEEFHGSGKTHGFIETLHQCFAYHKPLYIRPDDIKFMILQGIANLIALKEQGADAFVKHSEKKEVTAYMTETELKNDPVLVGQELLKVTTPHLTDRGQTWAKMKFSTTIPTHSLTAITALFACVKTRFKWRVATFCGIPSVTLLGKVEDWQTLHDATRELDVDKLFGSMGWTPRLHNFMAQLLATRKGEQNVNWWKSIYKYKEGSGSHSITGNCLQLFPVLLYKDKLQVVDFTKQKELKVTPSKPDKESDKYWLTDSPKKETGASEDTDHVLQEEILPEITAEDRDRRVSAYDLAFASKPKKATEDASDESESLAPMPDTSGAITFQHLPSSSCFFELDWMILGVKQDTIRIVAGMQGSESYKDGLVTRHGFHMQFQSKTAKDLWERPGEDQSDLMDHYRQQVRARKYTSEEEEYIAIRKAAIMKRLFPDVSPNGDKPTFESLNAGYEVMNKKKYSGMLHSAKKPDDSTEKCATQ